MSNAQSSKILTEASTHQHRQQKSKASIPDESVHADFKAAPMESTNFQSDIESDEYQGFDNDPSFDDASNHSESVQTAPIQLEQQSSEEIKPNREQMKGKHENEAKTGQTKDGSARLKKHRHIDSGRRTFECPLCSKS